MIRRPAPGSLGAIPASDAAFMRRPREGSASQSSSMHGGNRFAERFGTDSSPQPHRPICESLQHDGLREWTVHDGKFFSANVFSENPRAPQERAFLASSGYKDLFPPDETGHRTFSPLSITLGQVSPNTSTPIQRRRVRKDELALHHRRVEAADGCRSVGSAAAPSMPLARQGQLGWAAHEERLATPVSTATLRGRMDSTASRRWDEFTVSDTVLGRGRFSTVLKATLKAGVDSCDNGKLFALKVTCMPHPQETAKRRELGAISLSSLPQNPSDAEDLADDVECYLRELDVLHFVEHPHIVRCYGHGLIQTRENAEFGFLVLGLVDGVDLRQHLKLGLRMDEVIASLIA